eukprot:c19453_g1_i2.p2 GENE.c19453_g1_i2~~c19453_g1_i2.p2  ORF type:complete len:108 (+),score=18.66 c19453_g1_i2:672-995(+)
MKGLSCDTQHRMTLLHVAIIENQKGIFRALVEMGANLDAKAEAGMRPLNPQDFAAFVNFTEFVALIDQERRQRLHTFLLGTLRRVGLTSTVAMLPVDVLAMIAAQAV